MPQKQKISATQTQYFSIELYETSDEEQLTTDITPLSSQEESPDLLG